LILFDKASIFLVIFGDHGRDGISEGFTVNEPQKGRLESLDGCGSGCGIKKCQLSETFSWLDASLGNAVDFHHQLSLMEDEKRASHAVLFHQVLSLIDLA
jgi:hypothetical protein